MGKVTLEQVHEDIVSLKKDIEHIKVLLDEDFELADDLIKEIEESRKRDKFVSHEEMRKEFG